MSNPVLISEVWEYISRFKATHHCMSESRVSTETDGSNDFFQIDAWRCQQDRSIEQCKYYSPNPNRVIREIEYEGWRRHVEARRQNEGPRFIFHIRPDANSLKTQADLARLIDDSEFREMGGWLEPIRVDGEDPSLAVNFCEATIEDNPAYVDLLFQKINLIEVHESIPTRVITDLKSVIAFNCVERFKQKQSTGVFEDNFDCAVQLLRPCALNNVSSPYYMAALFCQDINQLHHARQLVRYIPMSHWQYPIARDLERSLYQQQIDGLVSRVRHLEHENRKLKDRLMGMKVPDYLAGVTFSTEPSDSPQDCLTMAPPIAAEPRYPAKPVIFTKLHHPKLMDVFELAHSDLSPFGPNAPNKKTKL